MYTSSLNQNQVRSGVHFLGGSPVHTHVLQTHEPLRPCGCYDPDAWGTLWDILGWHDVNYVRALRDSLCLLAPSRIVGASRRWTPTPTDRERAFWWLATRGYLLDGVLPTRAAVQDILVRLVNGRWPVRTVDMARDAMDQLLAEMRAADQASH